MAELYEVNERIAAMLEVYDRRVRSLALEAISMSEHNSVEAVAEQMAVRVRQAVKEGAE